MANFERIFFYPLHKMDAALASWKISLLSLAGHVIVAKLVLSVLPNHVIQSIPLSKSVCDDIDKKICDFIWGVIS